MYSGDSVIPVTSSCLRRPLMTATSRVVVSNVPPSIYGTGDKQTSEGQEIGFSAIVLRQLKRLDGLVPYLVADNWATFYITVFSTVLALVNRTR